MLGLYGFMKKKLELMGQLPDKWKDEVVNPDEGEEETPTDPVDPEEPVVEYPELLNQVTLTNGRLNIPAGSYPVDSSSDPINFIGIQLDPSYNTYLYDGDVYLTETRYADGGTSWTLTSYDAASSTQPDGSYTVSCYLGKATYDEANAAISFIPYPQAMPGGGEETPDEGGEGGTAQPEAYFDLETGELVVPSGTYYTADGGQFEYKEGAADLNAFGMEYAGPLYLTYDINGEMYFLTQTDDTNPDYGIFSSYLGEVDFMAKTIISGNSNSYPAFLANAYINEFGNLVLPEGNYIGTDNISSFYYSPDMGYEKLYDYSGEIYLTRFDYSDGTAQFNITDGDLSNGVDVISSYIGTATITAGQFIEYTPPVSGGGGQTPDFSDPNGYPSFLTSVYVDNGELKLPAGTYYTEDGYTFTLNDMDLDGVIDNPLNISAELAEQEFYNGDIFLCYACSQASENSFTESLRLSLVGRSYETGTGLEGLDGMVSVYYCYLGKATFTNGACTDYVPYPQAVMDPDSWMN